MTTPAVTFALGGTGVQIVDQRQLPGRLEELVLSTPQECYDAIATLAVRGAPMIGIFASHALAVLAQQMQASALTELLDGVRDMGAHLVSSRPTAVNLQWAVQRSVQAAEEVTRDERLAQVGFARQREAVLAALRAQAVAILDREAQATRTMAEHCLSLVQDGAGIVTHCNAGPLGIGGYGTALGPMLLGAERGMKFRVYADETRPLLQGARLTAYELAQAGVDVTVMCDNMASVVMGQGLVDACFVGADRVAANGDVANKVGTNGLAIVAAHYQVPFYVVCPTSTIDAACASGEDIPIEQRDPAEVSSKLFAQPMVPEGVACFNPAFDVTDHSLVTAIITEQGVHRPPYDFSGIDA